VDSNFDGARVARQAAIQTEMEVQAIKLASPALSPTEIMTPISLHDLSDVAV